VVEFLVNAVPEPPNVHDFQLGQGPGCHTDETRQKGQLETSRHSLVVLNLA
jgi:hypothetical protein